MEEIERQLCEHLEPTYRDRCRQTAGEDEPEHHRVQTRQHPIRRRLGGRAPPSVSVVAFLVQVAVPLQPRPEPLMQKVQRQLGSHLG